MEQDNQNIFGPCEVRRPGIGELRTDEGLKIWFSGDKGEREQRVLFLVHKKRL